MFSPEKTRGFALVALVVAMACGDDEGDDDTPLPDGNVPVEAGLGNDAGAVEAGAVDAGEPLMDGGAPSDGGGGSIDGGPLLDARVGAPDASSAEVQQALNRAGVRADARRAQLVLPAFCARGAFCGFDADAGLTEARCLTEVQGGWDQSVADRDSAECQDTLLDYWSCGATIACDMRSACEADFDRAADLCS